jgi:hypothetical protein
MKFRWNNICHGQTVELEGKKLSQCYSSTTNPKLITLRVSLIDRLLVFIFEIYVPYIYIKWMSEGNGRMSTLKKAGGTTGD